MVADEFEQATDIVGEIHSLIEENVAGGDVKTNNVNVGVSTMQPNEFNDYDEPTEVVSANVGFEIPIE